MYVHNLGSRSRNDLDLQYSHIFIKSICLRSLAAIVSLVTLFLNLTGLKHGKSYWKHNNSLLLDQEYLKTMNKKITDIKKQYMLPVYNIDQAETIPDEEIQFSINDQLFLEVLLMELRGQSISYASYKNKQKHNREKELELSEDLTIAPL